MARGTRTVYPGERNKGLSSTFQPPEEGRSVQQPKLCDIHGDKDEDNSPKNVNNSFRLSTFFVLSDTSVLNYLEELRITRVAVINSFARSVKEHMNKYY